MLVCANSTFGARPVIHSAPLCQQDACINGDLAVYIYRGDASNLGGRDAEPTVESASIRCRCAGLCHVSQAHDYGDRLCVARPSDGHRPLSPDASQLRPSTSPAPETTVPRCGMFPVGLAERGCFMSGVLPDAALWRSAAQLNTIARQRGSPPTTGFTSRAVDNPPMV